MSTISGMLDRADARLFTFGRTLWQQVYVFMIGIAVGVLLTLSVGVIATHFQTPKPPVAAWNSTNTAQIQDM